MWAAEGGKQCPIHMTGDPEWEWTCPGVWAPAVCLAEDSRLSGLFLGICPSASDTEMPLGSVSTGSSPSPQR